MLYSTYNNDFLEKTDVVLYDIDFGITDIV